VVEVFTTAAAAQRYDDLLGDAPATLVDDDALGSLGETVAPQGLVAVCRPVDRPVRDVLAGLTLAVVCADVRDPGNAGTVIRTADAAGAGAVVLAGHSVDAYNGKTVRSTVGSLFHVPLAVAPEPDAVLAACREAGLLVLAADGSGETDLDDAVDTGLLAQPTAWLFGNEAWGLPDELAALADHRVRIPIHGRAESLNLSTAAAVCLYASARAQRRA
jgi:TrmH family RNA methyltransferase